MNEPSEKIKHRRIIILRILFIAITILFFASGLWFLGIITAFLLIGSFSTPKNKQRMEETSREPQIIAHSESSELIKIAQQEIKKTIPQMQGLDNSENYEAFNCPIKDYRIEYCDRAGNITERNITINQFYRYENGNNSWWNLYLKAFCHLRNEDRTFHVQSIEHLFIENTEIQDIQGYFESIITGTKKWQCIKAISEHYTELKFLTFLSRAANGQMRRNQRDIIAKYIMNFSSDLPFEELSNEIKFVTCEIKEFNKLLKAPNISVETIPRFMECVAELLMLRNTPDPMESATFQKIKKSLKIS